MPSRFDDRWVWLGLTVFLSLAAINIRQCIRETVRLTEIDISPLEDDDAKNEEFPEDSIDLATLKTLIDSPNPHISNAAISIAVTRFGRTPQAPEMLVECYAQDDRLRHEARTIVHYLKDWSLNGHPEADWTDVESEGDVENGQSWTAGHWDRLLRNDVENVDGPTTDRDERVVSNEGVPLRTFVYTPPVDDGGEDPLIVEMRDLEAISRRRRNRVTMVLHEGDGYVEERDIYRPG